jgi:hypothetical protein
MARLADMSYKDLLRTILHAAEQRLGIQTDEQRPGIQTEEEQIAKGAAL